MKAKKNIPQGLIDQALSDYQTYEKYKEEMKCEYCEGRGKVENGLVMGMDLRNIPYITCFKCNGSGKEKSK